MLSVNIQTALSHFPLQADFKVGREIVVLFGPSGAGKTTILNIIAGLTKVDKGNIILGKRTLVKSGKSLVPVQNRRIGYVFQDYALFPHKTIWENIAYGMKNEGFAKALMEDLHISHLQQQYPHEVSGGEKQRTALIRALATEPELLLLDEPFSALDEKTKQESHHQLLQVHQKWDIPIILVSHNQREVNFLANKIYKMEKGKLIE